MAADRRLGVSLFGIGRAGMIHFQNLIHNPQVLLRYIVESDLDKAKAVIEKYHLQQTTQSVHSDDATLAVKDPSVRAVVVCAPTFEHEKIVRSALEHGKAVFCEKPLSQDEAGIKTLYELAEKVNQPLFCSFNRRFDPSFAGIRKRSLEGEVGSVQMVKTCSRDHPLPSTDYLRISGGMFHDCGVHDIDIICWILGEFPVEVFALAQAHIKDIRDLDDVDTVLISMRFPSGTLAAIDLSRFSAYGYDQRVEVFGSKGMLISENQRPTELTSLLKTGTSQDCIKYSFPQRYDDSYVLAMQHFFNVIEGKEQISVRKIDTINVAAIATACETSHRTGKPVQLNLGSI